MTIDEKLYDKSFFDLSGELPLRVISVGLAKQIIHEALKKQREICADMAKVFMPSHPALHLTTNVNKEEIKNAPEPEL